MIKRVDRLSCVGSFRHFQWPDHGLPEFSRFNLIYGWNYSGKTTLSRVFAAVGGQPLPTDWAAAKYHLTLDDGAKVDESDRSRAPNVEVFNRDYVRRAFKEEHTAPAHFVVGPENAELSRRRERTLARKNAIEQQRAELDAEFRRLTRDLNARLTTKAREINDGRQGKKFEKPQLETRLKEVRGAPEKYILSANDLDSARLTCAASKSDYAPIESPAYAFPDVKDWVERVRRLLGRTASRDAIEQLTKDPELEGWIRSGVAHHADRSHCLFCESPLQAKRLVQLQRHFADSYENLLRSIDSEIETLSRAVLDPKLQDSGVILPICRPRYSSAQQRLTRALSATKKLQVELIESLTAKRLRLEQATVVECDAGACVDGPEATQEIAAVIGLHNNHISQLPTVIVDAAEKFERHHSAQLCLDEDFLSKEREVEDIKRKSEKVDRILRKLTARIETIDLRISSSAIGAVELNKVLRCILSDSDISVADAANGRFEFRRGGSAATEMSEGERTAVTFAYFVASLKADGRAIGESVVFVDDPISSLDSNHLYATYALIIEQLCLAKQLFVSTHSSELFALLKKSFTNPKDDRFKRKHALYYLRRVRSPESMSRIENLPQLLRKHNSEYEFTFAQLVLMRASKVDESLAYATPNLLRKFLESYLGFRRPDKSSWSDKLDVIIDDPVMRIRVQKFADDASHLQRPGRAMEQPSYVPEAQACVIAVLGGLEKHDKDHYDSLIRAVDTTSGRPR